MSGSIACAGANGESLTIKGVNWFGFETSSTMMDGLWQGPNAITQNFQAVVWRIKLMGFNTVRIPFSFQVNCSHSLSHCCHSCRQYECRWLWGPAALVQPVTMRGITMTHSESQHSAMHSWVTPIFGIPPVKTEQ